jgi:excisionase family DNA binding protein
MSEDALTTRLPTEAEQETAHEAVAAMARAMTTDGVLPFKVSGNGAEVNVELPPALGTLLLEVLEHVAQGQMVTLVPHSANLTTQEAADLLNVSRPFLIKLLDSGVIDHHMVGSHRRISASELHDYKQRRDTERRAALVEMQRFGQEFEAADAGKGKAG